MLLRSRLPGVELRFSRLSDARAVTQLLTLRDLTDEGMPSSALIRSARVQSTEDIVDLIQTSFMAITATVKCGVIGEGDDDRSDRNSERPLSRSDRPGTRSDRPGTRSDRPGTRSDAHSQPAGPRKLKDRVVGFLALSTGPRVYDETIADTNPNTEAGPAPRRESRPLFPPDHWDSVFESGVYAGKDVCSLHPSNTLWASFFVSPSSFAVSTALISEGQELVGCRAYPSIHMMREMLTVALSVSYRTAHVLCPLPPSSSSSSMVSYLKEAFTAELLPLGLSSVRPEDFAFKGTLLHLRREDVIPALEMRPGRIEDYDDFVPLLVRGDGVITELPEDFFLEEILKDQDATHKVGIAENPTTHEVVGLTCAHILSLEEQQGFTRQYSLEQFNKLRPTGLSFKDKANMSNKASTMQGGTTTIRLDFLYFDDSYNGSAHEFVQYVFEVMFPTCEYLVVTLPHAQLESPLLRSFTYLPIRQYQPHNSRGEYAPVPPGLWVCSRHSVLNVGLFHARVIRTTDDRVMMENFLRLPSLNDLKSGVADKIREDLCISHEKYSIENHALMAPLPPTSVFQLCGAASETIGVASARRMMGKDLYTLKANYDLDEYLSLYSHTGKDYKATNISVKKPARAVPELKGILIRAMYVRPAFRSWIRFFVSEVLRFYKADIACTLTLLEEEHYAPLMREMICARPRRVVEEPAHASSSDTDEDNADEESASEESAGDGNEEEEEEERVDEEGGKPNDERKSDTDEGKAGDEEEGGTGEEEAKAEEEKKKPTEQDSQRDCRSSKSSKSSKTSKSSRAMGDVATLAALHFTTLRFLGDEKRRIHARVVVVGASATGLGFLHALLSTPFASFTNLTLISTDGLPMHPNQIPTLWCTDHATLMEREYLALQQGAGIRVVCGALVDLDKVNRFVSVDNGSFEPYDYLVLTAGRQYVLPPSVRQLLQQEGRTGKKSIIPLNGELALDRVRQTLSEIDVNANNVSNVMVYGTGLDALAVAAAMVEEGFSAQRIVVCAREESLPPYMDETTYQATSTLFRAIGINVFRGYDISRMEFDDENNLNNVLLAPVASDSKAGQSVELSCCLVICLEDKDIDASVLSALNKRSIVFDGRVIVNRRYRTTDPFVFAAGPVAMWTRRYGTTTPNFEDFNAKDVGYHLAQVMLGHLGFDEFLKLAARSGKRAMMAHLVGDAGGSFGVEDDPDGEDEDDDEDDGNWNSANTHNANDAIKEAANGFEMPGGGGPSDFKRMSFQSNSNVDRSAVNKQLRKKLPSYITPIARRLRLPNHYHFFSVQCVDAKLRENCDALTCNTVDPDKFSDFSDVLSPKVASVRSDTDAAAGAAAEKTTPAEEPTSQCVVTIYVNRHSRRIDGVSYFGLEEPPAGNFTALVGLPETTLNLIYRYKEARQRAMLFLASVATPSSEEAEGGGPQWEAVNLPAQSGLTAGVRCGSLDLMKYLRLPHLQTVFYDRFIDFFRLLEHRSRAHEEAVKLRERILMEHTLDRSLSPEQIAAYQAELAMKKTAFRYNTQLALIAFLHEHKNFRRNNMYLPNLERVITFQKAKAADGSNGVTTDPTMTVR